MIAIDNILVSDEVVEKQFVCDLNKCKGGCCVDGDTGAPITQEEANIIEDIYPEIKHLLSPNAIALIEDEGTHTFDDEYGLVTPSLNGGICAYGYYDELGIVKCAIEHVYKEGKIDFKKPISCHLFPIRITEYETFEAVNYEPRETLCKPACKLGKSLKVPVYQFLKEPLIRKYGEEFYDALDATAKAHYGIEEK
ncbi:MAG: DUF3109 family protein [Taibaiella sp.]